MSTCNLLDLQTLGSQPIMPKNLPDHCSRALVQPTTSKRATWAMNCHFTTLNIPFSACYYLDLCNTIVSYS